MKKLLIGFNSLLGGLILLLAAVNLTPNKAAKRSVQPPAARRNVRRQAAAPVKTATPLPELDKAVEKAIAADIFSNVRSPLANVRTGRSDMTLVGTFKMGTVEGAIVKQTNVNRQFNPFIMQAMRMAGGPGGMGGPPGGGGSWMNRMRGGNYPQWSAMGGRRSNTPVKQYVRVGETMANGYTLAEVTRTRAVLVRGNDKIELELQDPSKNRVAARNTQPRLNANQQFQQAQMFMQSQMLRTLQNMQRNGGQRGPAQAPPANRGRR